MIKICECGCGQEFEVNKRWKYRGNAQRFISGHNLYVKETRDKSANARKGKTYEEIFGEEKALELKSKCSERGKMQGGNPDWLKGAKSKRKGFKLTDEQKQHLREINTGKKHSQETKDLCRKKALEGNYGSWLIGRSLSSERREKQSLLLRGKTPKNNNTPGKYLNIKRGYFNILGKSMFFRSKWEANFARYLTVLTMSKEIQSWEYEADVFIFNEIEFGQRSYKPDFKVINKNNKIVYYEIKGYMDSKSKTKLKRMAKYYPEVELVLIDQKKYQELNKIYKNNIPGWGDDCIDNIISDIKEVIG